jgi:hypothetical protein
MVSCVRIKNYEFGLLNGSSGLSTFQTDTVVNGEILRVDWKSNTTGSIALQVSGSAIELFRRNAPSGAAWQSSLPLVFGQNTIGSIAGATMYPVPVNSPLILRLEGVPSGATLPTVAMSVYYR